MNPILKNTLILFLITLIAGGLLAGAYAVTSGPIARAEAEAEQKALSEVCPDAARFEDSDTSFENHDRLTYGTLRKALDGNGALIGYAVNVTTSAGYGGDIQIMIGADLQGKVIGIRILSASNESPGLGANCLNADFQAQFAGKTPGLTYSKTGAEGNEIDAISGATITTKAVTEAVNDAVLQIVALGGD
ncbi:MAG: RnfABCDGE type electron transport complex subunit G [Clostridia bacterium]|nr:RnfABCDGE type electron transport complex subunit G [Clostridia bacterium]